MAHAFFSTLLLLLLLLPLPAALAKRSSFPTSFVFGAASSSYQVPSLPSTPLYEGAVSEEGRGPSIWDTFTHTYPEEIADKSNGDVAVDFYHRFKEDIKFLKYMGMDAFRFSISWSRILPNGSLSGGINREGIDFYDNDDNSLIQFSTSLRKKKEKEEETITTLGDDRDDFRDYAELCFKEFGDRVKHWITFNEPWSYCSSGYSSGLFPPNRCSPFEFVKCGKGNSSIEPYLCAHHQLLAHAAAAKIYRDKYQVSQKGLIGITLVSHWFVPYSNTKEDEDAVSRSLNFMFGWFMDPLTQGDYPFTMRAIVGDRLPKFSTEQSQLVKSSFDFIGLNYYTTYFADSISLLSRVNVSYDSDSHSLQTGNDSVYVEELELVRRYAASSWLFIYPRGIREIILYLKNKYNNPLICITENGVDEVNNASWPLDKALQDDMRIDYYKQHLHFVGEAIREGANVRGYFAWSLLDNFEWLNGYTVRFGIIYVDYRNGLKRYPKRSTSWFQQFLNS
ncbi:hypothetical protein ZIOFF_047601 [Zingiber officinale]|uniref:Beta-glucosidase n=1 Tax=Zingiber officinale TaxID=94328 RepID=A0A8J5FXL6_ZINOF|nr:hypothetical protein ZIOFF_047601 [Zingiber officinale]